MCSTMDENEFALASLRFSDSCSKGVPICIKCKSLSSQVLIRHSTYCRDCFLHVFSQKFRLNMARARNYIASRDSPDGLGAEETAKRVLLPRSSSSETRMIYFDGTFQSAALIHSLCESMRAKHSGKTGNLDLIVCHVVMAEEGNLEFYDNLFSNFYGVKYFPVSHDDRILLPDDTMISSSKSDSSLAGLQRFRIKRILKRVARQMNVTMVILGDSGTFVSCTLFAELAKGNGWSLPYETNLVDDDDDEEGENESFNGDRKSQKKVVFLRPFREHLDKEIALYCHFNQLYEKFGLRPVAPDTKSATIEQITKDFFIKLDQDYPSTISTVFKTSLKIKTRGSDRSCNNSESLAKRCSLCDRKIQPDASSWIRKNTIFSMDQIQSDGKRRDDDESTKSSRLCYSCTRLFD